MSDLRLMSREFVTEFIDLYRQNECLWKIKSRDYSDKHKKNAAYNILINKLKEVDPQANKDAVIKKVNSLRTCFRKELKKYNASLRSGTGTEDIQKPNLWYFDLLLFLTDQETPRQDCRDNIEDKIVSPISESEHDVDIIDEFNSVDDINEPCEPSRAKSADSFASTSTSGIISRSTSINTSTTSKKRKRDRSDEVLEIIANSLQFKTKAQTETVGKYASYGQHIAQELQDLPPEMAIYCKRIINEAIYHGQLGNLTSNSRIANEVEHAFNDRVEQITYPTIAIPLQSSTAKVGEYYSQFLSNDEFNNISYSGK